MTRDFHVHCKAFNGWLLRVRLLFYLFFAQPTLLSCCRHELNLLTHPLVGTLLSHVPRVRTHVFCVPRPFVPVCMIQCDVVTNAQLDTHLHLHCTRNRSALVAGRPSMLPARSWLVHLKPCTHPSLLCCCSCTGLLCFFVLSLFKRL